MCFIAMQIQHMVLIKNLKIILNTFFMMQTLQLLLETDLQFKGLGQKLWRTTICKTAIQKNDPDFWCVF